MKNFEFNKEMFKDSQVSWRFLRKSQFYQVKALVSSLRTKIQRNSSQKIKHFREDFEKTVDKPQENEEKLAKCIAKELLKDKTLLNKLHSTTSLRAVRENL
ncbi:MAG: hypothetical protein H6620_12230 [Halobacteriovoraceae bacterium]|nr:hypothetical protein [Halobacteriovoraceae bacterium]